MTMEEAQEILQEIKHYLTAGNPVWDKEVVAEALDIAIEALTQDSRKVTKESTQDLISRQDAIDAWWHDEVFFGNQRDDMTKEQWLDYITDVISSLPSEDEQDDNRLYIRIYANDEPSRKAEKLYQICGETESQEVAQWLKEYFPSADRPTGECRTCGRNADNGGAYEDGRTKCPIQEHYALLLDGYCHLYEPYGCGAKMGGNTE